VKPKFFCGAQASLGCGEDIRLVGKFETLDARFRGVIADPGGVGICVCDKVNAREVSRMAFLNTL
jgi:hypothetical protein